MGRPAASKENKAISSAFGQLVSQATTSSQDLVARHGECSIYSLLKEICPSIVRDDNTGARNGISETEFNKVLQVDNFACKVPVFQCHDKLFFSFPGLWIPSCP
jgi:hypothetical protein